MNDRTYSFFAILLIGICACLPEDAEPIDERFDEIDTDEANASESGSRLEADFNGDGYADLAIGVPRDRLSGVQVGGVNVLYGSAGGLTATGNQLWNQDSPGIEGVAESDDDFGAALAAGDFNGDEYTDLAIGVPFDHVEFGGDAGAINVLYGSANGLTATGNQIWDKNTTTGIAGSAEAEEVFGGVLTSGDFDGDGHDDLAIGVPYNISSGLEQIGVVHILRGSSAGLTQVGNQLWHQDIPGVDGVGESPDFFGSALATGDFDGDGRDDLAIGVPGEDLGDVADAGGVNVLYGSNSGLSGSGDQFWDQNTDGIEGVAETDDGFGSALTVGDFDGDGRDDLAVGVPGEAVGSKTYAGAVNTIYGSSGGLSASGDEYWYQDQSGVEGVSDEFDGFGSALAAGDFDEDGRDDLAIASPGEDLENTVHGGLVNVLYGSSSGLSSSGDQLWHQKISGIEGVAESFDQFGHSLSAGDYDHDGATDLAIGVPLDTPNAVEDTGAINVIYGSNDGLDESGDQLWHQDSPNVLGVAEFGELFGSAVR